ncbi:MAG: GlcG/HbpS family heme-binding protein [Thiohalorhabdus sp.]|uniref:GlcG/HbpS family heme-binding protein n=1 Tax=Thiohalorhabdus sp. TaxID=3094134 RepID=UPI00397F3A59
MVRTAPSLLAGALLALAAPLTSAAEEGTFNTPGLVPETAMKVVEAAMTECRDRDAQVAVAVVDRGGNTQALKRDQFAGPHTTKTAVSKAWTAISFRTDTLELRDISEPGKEGYGIQHLPRVTVLGGGKMIQNGGRILAGIGVSGAPSGAIDDECAAAGIDAIREEIL